MTANAGGPKAFAVSRLTLTDFRNYESLRLDVPRGLIALVGHNGAGKTNLLEALSLLAPGRGMRGADMREIGRHGAGGAWAVSARIEAAGGETQLGTAWSPGGEDEPAPSRAVLINGHLQRSTSGLSEHLRLIWLTPALDRLFAGPPSDRRRHLDRMVATMDPGHATRVSGFEKLMRERNLLLQDGRADGAWLSSLEAQLAEKAISIAASRLDAAHRLNLALRPERMQAPFPWGSLTVLGDSEDLVQALPALAAEESYRATLRDSRYQDRAAGRTLAGPHRSDFMMQHGPKGIPASEGSTGEQKALLIGLLLAQIDTLRELAGASPVLLLDEVSAHLDKARRQALFGLLESHGVQAWMTGTEAEVFDGAGPSTMVYLVDHGTLRESKN